MPSIREFRGRDLMFDMVAVEITGAVGPEAVFEEYADNNTDQTIPRSFRSLICKVIPFNSSSVRRVVILQYFHEPIGTAILCASQVPVNDNRVQGIDVTTQKQPTSVGFHASDLRAAVVLGDLRLYGGRSEML